MPIDNDKAYEELYKYSKDIFDEDLGRSIRIDNKAAKYLSILTAIIGLYTLLGRQLFADIIPPENINQKCVLFFALLVLIGLIYSWILLFKIIKARKLEKLPLHDNFFNYFNSKEKLYGDKGLYYGLAWNNKLAYENNKIIIDIKSDLLKKAYNAIAVTVVLLVFFVGSTFVNEWQKGVKPEVLPIYKIDVRGNINVR